MGKPKWTAMKRYILLLFLLVITAVAHAELPQIVALGKQASKHQDVKHTSVGSIMLGMAGTFAEKEQRATFKMLDNIEIIECKNRGYAPTLVARTKSIANEVDAEFIGSKDDGKALNELYGISKGGVITELIIVVTSHNGNASVVAMSGEIPHSRLGEIEKIKR
jgi:hypothetical protein